MKKLIAIILALTLALALVACSNNGDSKGNDTSSGSNETNGNDTSNGEDTTGSQYKSVDKIVLWTLSNDLKQFAERYTELTGNEVEVVVFDSRCSPTSLRRASPPTSPPWMSR